MAKLGTIRESGSLGDKLLPKITTAVRDVMIATKKAMLPWEHHVRVKATQDIIDKIGHEIADHYGPFIDKILEQDTSTLDPAVLKWLQDSRSGEDQLKAVSGLLMGSAQSAIGTFLSNELAPFVYAIVGLNPNLDLDPATAAQAYAQRQVSYDNGQSTAAAQGYGAGIWAVLSDMALTYPGAADAINLFQRGFISQDQLVLSLQRNGVPEQFIAPLVKSADSILSLADAALAYLRSDITLAEAQDIAHQNGFSDANLNIFIGNTGEPPGEEQLAEAFRRDFITEADFERGVKQSRIRNEWIPMLLKMRYAPMSVADAVNAVVQNHLAMADGQNIALQNGLEASAFPILYETAGEPLSRTEMEDLYNRGLVSQSDVEQASAESRLKNKYIPDAFALHVKLLEPRMLSSAVEVGAVTQADAIKRALEHGYSVADAQILVNEGTQRKLHTAQQQTVAAAESMYIDNIITDAELTDVAKAAGFEQSEIDVVITSAEYRRQAKWITNVLSVIRSKYVAHHIAQADASSYIDSLGIPAANRDQLLAIWAMELAANTAELTTAEIVKAAKKTTITPDDAMTRLQAKGYSATDAQILLEDA
jgi:hypothetical protein